MYEVMRIFFVSSNGMDMRFSKPTVIRVLVKCKETAGCSQLLDPPVGWEGAVGFVRLHTVRFGAKFMGRGANGSWNLYLILVDLSVLQFGLALLLERDDDQGHENVYKEKWEHDEVYDVENGHFDAKVLYWTLVFVCCGH